MNGYVEFSRSVVGSEMLVGILLEWEKQAAGETQAITEADLTLAAWLARVTMLVPSREGRPFVGGIAPMLTHVVVDEVQDVSPVHIRLLRRVIHPQGTMTVVGDLRQRITTHGLFENWKELGLDSPKRAIRAIFTVNHRQSRPLGEFIRALHHKIFGEWPKWRSSERREAPLPRIRSQRGNQGLARAIADEVRHWRDTIPGTPTVAVLYHGRPWDGLQKLAKTIEEQLGDTLTEVRYAVGKARARQLNQTDCVIVATTAATKGLEYDAVVVIDPKHVWRRPLTEISELRRNGLYVAASRAKQGLSMIIDDRSELLADGALAEYVKVIPQE